MDHKPANAEPKQAGRFQPGQSGNPAGKRKGTRHRATMLAEKLLEGQADALVNKAVKLALAGDTTALRLCIDRLVPPRRDRPVRFALPPVTTAADAVAAMGAIVAAVASGELTPGEAGELSGVLSAFAKTIEIRQLEERVSALEKAAT